MEIDGRLFSDSQLLLCGLIYAWALIAALRMAPWERLSENNRIHVFLGTGVVLICLWLMRGDIHPALSYHLLGMTTVTLMFGWSLAVIIGSLSLLAVSLNGGFIWQSYLLSVLTIVLVPVTLTQFALVLVRSFLPKNFFIYVLLNGFVTAWLAGSISGLLALSLLIYSGAFSLTELTTTILPFFPMMFLPEAFINGWSITILVLYFPGWVRSFSDEQYINGK